MVKFPFQTLIDPIEKPVSTGSFAFAEDIKINLNHYGSDNPFDTDAEINQLIEHIRTRFRQLKGDRDPIVNQPNEVYRRYIFHNMADNAFTEDKKHKQYYDMHVYQKGVANLNFDNGNIHHFEHNLMRLNHDQNPDLVYTRSDVYEMMYQDFIVDAMSPVYENGSVDGMQYLTHLETASFQFANPYDIAFKFSQLKSHLWEKIQDLQNKNRQAANAQAQKYEMQHKKTHGSGTEKYASNEGPFLLYEHNPIAQELAVYLRAADILEKRQRDGKEFTKTEQMFFNARESFESVYESIKKRSAALKQKILIAQSRSQTQN